MIKINAYSWRVIALIPARGGSKGVPRKNLVKINGRPMIEYTIKAAIESKFIDDVWVSSDDSEILEFSKLMGSNTLVRPGFLATDEANPELVVEHFCDKLGLKKSDTPTLLAYLQPTSPLRNSKHIDAAFEAMAEANLPYLVSIKKNLSSPFKFFMLNEEGKLQSLFNQELSNRRRQDLPDTFIPNGAIYIFPVKSFEKNKIFPSNGSLPFIMNLEDSIDVDSEEDIATISSILQNKIK
jgi:CMP-N,N'-diacetyllegionaminic acid synthase